MQCLEIIIRVLLAWVGGQVQLGVRCQHQLLQRNVIKVKIHDLKYQKDANASRLYQSIFKHIFGEVEGEVYLVVVERLVGVDGHEDCGKAEGVVVDQEESDDGDHDVRHDGGDLVLGHDGDHDVGHEERW